MLKSRVRVEDELDDDMELEEDHVIDLDDYEIEMVELDEIGDMFS